MFEAVTITLLIVFMTFREVLHHMQVKDLTLKIKSRDAEEYVQAKQALVIEPEVKVPETPAIPLNELDPDTALEAVTRALNEEDTEEV